MAEPREDAANPGGIAFWRAHLRTGMVIFLVEAAACLIYVLTSSDRPQRNALIVILCGSLPLVLLPLSAIDRIARSDWRSRFSFVWTLLSGVLLTISAGLDGGLDSPLLYLSVLPIMYAAIAMTPAETAACASAALAELIAILAVDRDIVIGARTVFMLFAVIIGTAALAVVTSVNYARLRRLETEHERDLKRLANLDGLTNCLNHRSFYEELGTEVTRSRRSRRPLALLLLDVDFLKAINDEHGHAAGDAALKAVAEVIQGCCRRSDLAGRIGGDEFALLLPGTDARAAEEVATRICAQVRLSDARVTVSVGAASLNDELVTARQLVRAADEAMYNAKANGRDCVAVHGEPTPRTNPREALSPGLADAKRVSQRLRQLSRERAEMQSVWNTLQTAAPVGLAFLDPDLVVVTVNRELQLITDTPTDQQVGEQAAVVFRRIWPRLAEMHAEVLSTGTPVRNVEISCMSEDGTPCQQHALLSLYPVVVDDELIGFGLLLVDITERKQWELRQAAYMRTAMATLASLVEYRDPYTAGHQRRVAVIAAATCRELGLDQFTSDGVELAASVHDIGKIAVPAEILAHPGVLGQHEFALVREHATAGAAILADVDFPWPIAAMVRQHHERMDGSGYPDALAGNQIDLGARIIAVADVIEAMASHRPYRPSKGLDAALTEIESGSGTRYDAEVVAACLRLFREGRLRLDDGLWADPAAVSSDYILGERVRAVG